MPDLVEHRPVIGLCARSGGTSPSYRTFVPDLVEHRPVIGHLCPIW